MRQDEVLFALFQPRPDLPVPLSRNVGRGRPARRSPLLTPSSLELRTRDLRTRNSKLQTPTWTLQRRHRESSRAGAQ